MSQEKTTNSFLYKKLNKESSDSGDKGKNNKMANNMAIKEKTTNARNFALSIVQTFINPIWNLLCLVSYIVKQTVKQTNL